jgi:hypothetical protein
VLQPFKVGIQRRRHAPGGGVAQHHWHPGGAGHAQVAVGVTDQGAALHGHTQFVAVDGLGRYRRLGTTIDDALGEAFDKTAKSLGLGYPGGPALCRLAGTGQAGRFRLPRPKLHSEDLDFSFSGLKTAVWMAARGAGQPATAATNMSMTSPALHERR